MLININPLKWRKPVTDLFALKKQLENIEEFSVLIIAMTQNELLRLYFANDIKI